MVERRTRSVFGTVQGNGGDAESNRYASGVRAFTCPLRIRAMTLSTDWSYSASEANMAC